MKTSAGHNIYTPDIKKYTTTGTVYTLTSTVHRVQATTVMEAEHDFCRIAARSLLQLLGSAWGIVVVKIPDFKKPSFQFI